MKATKKLAFATIALIAASSLTVGSTFAWFSYQSSVTLGAVNFSVDSSDANLHVAVVKHDAANPVTPALSDFTYSLSTESIKTAINNGVVAGRDNAVVYKPLTVKEDSANTVAVGNLIDLMNNGETTQAARSDYAVFDLVFRYTPAKTSAGQPNTNMPSLILDYGSVVTGDPENDTVYTPKNNDYVAWQTMDATTYGKALEVNKAIPARARDAARVAFLFNDGAKKNKVWAPSEEQGTGVVTSDSVKGFYKGNLANDYNLHYNHVPAGTVVKAPTYASRVYAAPSGGGLPDSSKITVFPAMGTGKTYSELRITVKVWIEGKDGDCISSIEEDKFAFLLKFRTSPVASS